MADNVTTQSATLATVPASTVIATDEVAVNGGTTGHVQYVKLVDGTGNGTDGIQGSAANGLEVFITNAASVGGGGVTDNQAQTSSGLTTASTNYTTGDTVGAGWTFTSMATATGGHGIISGVALLDEGDVLEGLRLWFSSGSITFGTDNAAPSVSDTDARKLIGDVSVPVSDLGGCRFGSISGLKIPYVCDATSLFVYATTLSGNTFFAAVSDLKLTLFYEVQD